MVKEKLKINLGNFFWRVVRGYMILSKMKGLPSPRYPTPLEAAEIRVPSLKLGEIKAEKLEIKEGKEGVPLVSPEPMGVVRLREPEVDLRTINIIYTLIPSDTRTPFAAANIKWSPAESSLIYYLIEPRLTPQEKDLLEKIKTSLIEKLDIDFTTLRKGEARGYLKKKFEEMIILMAKEMPIEKQRQFLYFIERDFIGLGKIEPLMKDLNIEDISCDGVGVPIYIYHRNSVIGSVKTTIVFKGADELDTFVNKLAQRAGKTVSIAKPLVGGSLPDGSRIQATLGTDIARKGSNFTIRKFTERPLTPVNLLNLKTIDTRMAAFLWVAIEYGRSILITGGVASGKTTLLNALSLFIKPELRIVSIEDTPELRLPHPHWVPSVARLPIAEIGGKKLGEVDLFDLLRESLRQRPDYLIVGEVRGREAYVLFQQIATGHASMSTIHADSMERLMDRLTTPPISLPGNLVEALDIVIFLMRLKYGTTYVRRISTVYEILGFDREKNIPIVNEIFKWNPENDTFNPVNPSIILKKISQQYGVPVQNLQIEINHRMKVIDWMVDKNIQDYRDVARVVKLYYSRKEELLSAI